LKNQIIEKFAPFTTVKSIYISLKADTNYT